MTRIITHNNTRHRRHGKPCGGGLRDPVGPCQSFYAGHSDPEKAICKGHHTPLPEIEDWPGHRPEQYLTDDPACPVRTGDLIALETPLGWSFFERMTEEPMTLGEILSDEPDVNPELDLTGRAYLISRANPEHDAEDTP